MAHNKNADPPYKRLLQNRRKTSQSRDRTTLVPEVFSRSVRTFGAPDSEKTSGTRVWQNSQRKEISVCY